MGRFINSDSILGTNGHILGYNLYTYCYNNPVNCVDYFGNKPGDLFTSELAAAKDFAAYYGTLTAINGTEYGSTIYTVNKTSQVCGLNGKSMTITTVYYSYSVAAIGTRTPEGHYTVTPSKEPKKTTPAAKIHTHPLGSDSNVFSPDDIWYADHLKIGGKNGVYLPIYLAAPNGDILRYKKYDPYPYDIVIYSGPPFSTYCSP